MQTSIIPQDSPETRPEFGTPVSHRWYNLNQRPVDWRTRLELEVANENKALKEKYRPSGKKPSGKEVHEIRLNVSKRQRKHYFQRNLSLALWDKSEEILDWLRIKAVYPPPDQETINQNIGKFFGRLNLKEFPEADPNSPLYLGRKPITVDSVEKSCFAGFAASLSQFKQPIGPNEYFELNN
jgi:hypothetical protein